MSWTLEPFFQSWDLEPFFFSFSCFQRLLQPLSLRPGTPSAINIQFFPKMACFCMSNSSSAAVHPYVLGFGTFFSVLGFGTFFSSFSFFQRLLQPRALRPGKPGAINTHWFPKMACFCMINASSAAVQLQSVLGGVELDVGGAGFEGWGLGVED